MERITLQMAVNVGQRNVPDTPANRQLEACQKAMELALHTIRVCKNKNIFTEEYQETLTNDIIATAKDIYVDAWEANNIYVRKDNGRWKERERLQLMAIRKCNRLLAMINLARRLFHLKGNKVIYWSQMTIDTRQMLYRWHEANAKQYGT